MCVNTKCNDTVKGRFKKLVPLCPSCRYLAKWVFGLTMTVCGVVFFVIKNAGDIIALVRK